MSLLRLTSDQTIDQLDYAKAKATMTATMPDTQLTGQMLIAGESVRGSGKQIRAFDPAAGQDLEPAYYYGDASNVDAACAAAAAAFADYRATSSEQRAQFLESVAANIEAAKDAIVDRAVAASPVKTAAPPDSSGCSPACSARAAGTAPASTRHCPIGRRCRGPISASARYRSVPSRSSAPATSP